MGEIYDGPEREPVGTSPGVPWWVWLLGILALLAVAAFFLLPLLAQDAPGEEAITASVAEIAADPDPYFGTNVVVRATVVELVSPTTFLVADEEAPGAGVAVVSAEEVAGEVAPGAVLLIEGQVRPLDPAMAQEEVAEELDTELGGEEVMLVAGAPSIIVESIEVIE